MTRKRFLLLLLILGPISLYAQSPVISPAVPVVNEGATQQFTETLHEPGTWSCAGTDGSGNASSCAGSINSSTGLYTAPAIVKAQQTIGGYQLLPNNHIFNTRIDSMPVCDGVTHCTSSNTTWLNLVNIGGQPYQIDTWVNQPINFISTGNYQTPSMLFQFTPANNGAWELPLFPAIKCQGGWFSATGNSVAGDHHCLSIDTATGVLWESYQYFPWITTTAASVTNNIATLTLSSDPTIFWVPGDQASIECFTGGDTFFNVGAVPLSQVTPTTISFNLSHANATASSAGTVAGFGYGSICPTVVNQNSVSGIHYRNYDYGLPSTSATAGGMEMVPLELRLQEMEQAVATGGTINHALRLTLASGFLCSCNIWPATTFATDGHTIPFGQRIRLNPSFPIGSFNAVQQVILKNWQQYGWLIDDGGLTFDVGGESTAWPDAYVQAFRSIWKLFDVGGYGQTAPRVDKEFTITNTQVVGGVATVTATNDLVANNLVWIGGTTNDGGILNNAGIGNAYTVTSANSTSFQFSFGTNFASAADSGTAYSPTTNYLQFIDESSLMVSSTSGLCTCNREKVTFTRTSDNATATVDVELQGTAVNFSQDFIYFQAGAPGQQLPVLVNIGGYACSMNPSVGTLSSNCFYTPPSTQAAKTTTTITATSTLDGTVAAQINVIIFPSAAIRVLPSQISPDYTDSFGNVWYAWTGSNQPQDRVLTTVTNCGSAPGFTDGQLFKCFVGNNAFNLPETRLDFVVPNQTYQVSLGTYNSVAPGVGQYKITINGKTTFSGDISAVAGGANQAVRFVTQNVTVTNNKLSVAMWNVNNQNEPVSWLSIIPGASAAQAGHLP